MADGNPAADTSGTRTRIEDLLAAKGELIVKEFRQVGSLLGQVGQITVQALTLYEPFRSTDPARGVKVEVSIPQRGDDAAFLDAEEVEAACGFLARMKEVADRMKPEVGTYREVIYTTNGGFRAGFWTEGKQGFFGGSGSTLKAFVQVGTSLIPVDFPRLAELAALLEKATGMLRSSKPLFLGQG